MIQGIEVDIMPGGMPKETDHPLKPYVNYFSMSLTKPLVKTTKERIGFFCLLFYGGRDVVAAGV